MKSHLCCSDLQGHLQLFSLDDLLKSLQSKPFVMPDVGEDHFDSNTFFLTYLGQLIITSASAGIFCCK